MRKIFSNILFLTIALVLVSCGLPAIGPTAIPPSPTPCAWVEADNNTPDIDHLIMDELSKAGIQGAAKTKNYGESGGETCSYIEKGVRAEIIIIVADTTDLPALTTVAAKVEGILANIPSKHKFSLANSGIRLQFSSIRSTDSDCIWDFANGKCK